MSNMLGWSEAKRSRAPPRESRKRRRMPPQTQKAKGFKLPTRVFQS